MKKKTGIILLAVLLCAVLVLMVCAYFIFDMANWQNLDPSRLHGLAQTSSLYDSHEELMSEIRGTENRTLISLTDIPRHTQLAFIAAEDLRFYEHKGIDFYRILGALRSNLKSGTLAEGASTITQQLAKLTHLSAEKTIRRKLEEIHLALQIEQAYSKDEILEFYLNTVYFGRGAYGLQAAARAYFDIDAADLSLSQSASLAATIKAPSAYAPHTNPENNRTRRLYILSTMAEHAFITQEQYEAAKSESIWVLTSQKNAELRSWYVDEVLRESSELLQLSVDEIISSGYSIYSAYSPELQSAADRVYSDRSLFPANASDGTPMQSAMAVIDTQDGC